MPDFTSALYLGLRHDHALLRPWRDLTTGRPAALGPSTEADVLEERLAGFLGCEAVALGPSTLHLYWDLFDMLARDDISLHIDRGSYPIARWGAEHAGALGVPIWTFRSHDAAALEMSLARRSGSTPLVVADGLNALTGNPLPVPPYLRLLKQARSRLIIDDTQALGLLGERPDTAQPYGLGGGGVAAWFGVRDPRLVRIASLAKAFGAPLALIGGSRRTIERFKAESVTRVHCSPPSAAALAAVHHALAVNESHGDALRARLLELVRQFRKGLFGIGLSARGGSFPMQTLVLPPSLPARDLHAALGRLGVISVLHRAHQGSRALISFLLNAGHSTADIAMALDAIRRVAGDHTRNEDDQPALPIQE